MTWQTTRRNLLKFLGGGAVAVPFTPLPWKLLGDTAIWTQNWERIPKLPRGEMSTRFTTCTLCPAACAVRAKCIGGRPVGLGGVPGHPLSFGALCPLGLGAHQLPYHPRRLSGAVARGHAGETETRIPVAIDHVITVLAETIRARAGADGAKSVALLDSRPGRALSALYRRFVSELPDGVYVTPSSGEEAWWRTLNDMLDDARGPMGYDLANTRTILSFGSPILDGWGTPGRIEHARFGAGERRPRIVQVETRPSRTALFADRWLAVRPGTEAALALGLAHVIVREHLFDEAKVRSQAIDFETRAGGGYLSLIATFPPERVANLTGLRAHEVIETAREFAGNGPSIAVAEGDPGGGSLGREEQIAVWGLNLIVGSIGRPGGIVPTRTLPNPPGLDATDATPAMRLDEVPNGSLRVLILDGSASGSALPWTSLKMKLAGKNALVVSLSPYLVGHARHAAYVVPAPAWLEGFEEAPTPPGAERASLSLSHPLLTAPAEAVDSAELVRRLAAALDVALPGAGGSAALIEERVQAIHAGGRGQVFRPSDGSLVSVASLGSPKALWQSLGEGATWLDDKAENAPLPRFRLLGSKEDGLKRLAAAAEGRTKASGAAEDTSRLVVMPFALRGSAGEAPVTPLASKLYRESNLRDGPGMAVMNPETAKDFGAREGARVRIQVAGGWFEARVALDPSVLPLVVHVPVGPDPDRLGEPGESVGERILSLCGPDERGCWRAAPARLREA